MAEDQANTPKLSADHKASFKDRMAMFKKTAESEATVAGGFSVISPEGFQSRQRTLSKASGAAYTRESMKLKGKVHSTAETEETMRVKKQMNRQSTNAYKKDAEASRHKVQGTGVGEIERVKEQSKLSSTVQYKKAAEAGYKGKGMAVATTIESQRVSDAGNLSSSVAYSKDVDKLKGKAPASHLKGGGAPSPAAAQAPEVVKATPAPTPTPAPEPEPVAAEPEPEAAEPVAEPEPEAAEPEPEAAAEPAAEATEEPAADAADAEDEDVDDGKKWIAQYDYAAADKEEVSFSDGDVIIKVKEVDEGWVSGTVEKTGESGMLPSNYIEPAPEDGAEPAAEPEVAEPEPEAAEAVAEPEAAEAVAEPEAAEPVAEPEATAAEPEAAEAVAEPEAAEPVAEPEAAEPVAEPEAEAADEPAAEPAAEASGEEWKAEYDYTAADEDEVSFAENDIFINVETVDEGWVKGTLKVTGASGMLPSNYIVKCE